ncbi:hypothetical protein QFZ43_005854 [Streptomyces afghaniensis]|nr:hypothetical protein [Streptomyces afghaniensis]
MPGAEHRTNLTVLRLNAASLGEGPAAGQTRSALAEDEGRKAFGGASAPAQPTWRLYGADRPVRIPAARADPAAAWPPPSTRCSATSFGHTTARTP